MMWACFAKAELSELNNGDWLTQPYMQWLIPGMASVPIVQGIANAE